MATHERRVVFFDLDGTLHQQDMFGSFLRYLLRRQPLNALLVLPLLPIIAIALLIKGRAAGWSGDAKLSSDRRHVVCHA